MKHEKMEVTKTVELILMVEFSCLCVYIVVITCGIVIVNMISFTLIVLMHEQNRALVITASLNATGMDMLLQHRHNFCKRNIILWEKKEKKGEKLTKRYRFSFACLFSERFIFIIISILKLAIHITLTYNEKKLFASPCAQRSIQTL